MQMDALKAAGVEVVYSEVASGARTDRPGLTRATARGNVLTVYKLDRLRRTVSQLPGSWTSYGHGKWSSVA